MGTSIVFFGGAVVTAAVISGEGKVLATAMSNTRSRALSKVLATIERDRERAAHTRTATLARRTVRNLGRLSA